jgi:tetratricopeptide (TPR) repeat protein
MSNGKNKSGKSAPSPAAATESPALRTTKPLAVKPAPIKVELAGPRPPLFRRIDWITAGVTTLLLFVGYMLTLGPDLTLEDCGELAVGSYYAAVPHAPGYPVWTIYSWLFTVLLPFSNVAWRVSVSSAVSASLACGLLGLLVSRGCSMILESIQDLRDIDRRWESTLCMVSGAVAAMMIGLNGFMWSQAVIVEVYCLSVLSLMGVLLCLLQWTYAPEKRWCLYLGGFLFGICFNNHQTLIVAAMGLEVLIALVRPGLGRNVFLLNTVIWAFGLLAKSLGILTSFDQNAPLFFLYNAVGVGSLAVFGYLWYHTKTLRGDWAPVFWTFLAWLIGAAFYFYLPLTSATNPPMNWAYPRTWDGFIHAFSRGQYEKTNPSDIFGDPLRFVRQLQMYFLGAADEFHPSFLLLSLVPFFFLHKMAKRERAWIWGNTAIFCCLAFLLLILLNPNTDRQSRDQTKVFFTASHVTIAMFLGFGLALIGAMLLKFYERARTWAWVGGAVLAAFAFYSLTSAVYSTFTDPVRGMTGLKVFFVGLHDVLTRPSPTQPVLGILAAGFVLVLLLAFIAVVLLNQQRLRLAVLAGFFAAIPVFSVVGHWADNEQRQHLFGFYFGHDMFKPPLGKYPEMTRNAILFGGTDPGRFCPTYMIFDESFIKPECRRDPAFDRRDVYIITQNALADGTYLNYIRAHYNRSTQQDPPFLRDMVLYFQGVAMGKAAMDKKARGEPHRTNSFAKIVGSLTNVVAPVDRWIMDFGRRVEERRRREGVFPPKEIITPSPDDLGRAYNDYIGDATRRKFHDRDFPNEPRQMKLGEVVNVTPDGRAQVAGQVAVMAINALLTKDIFDSNPTNEFYVEESFPLDWMYPYLSPYGIIMKLNRQPLPALSDDLLKRDHEFWSAYSGRLIGNWITYDTTIKDLCAFAERVYRRGDLRGYTGDPKFLRDNDAQKAFSKLRNSLAGLYAWRLGPDCPAAFRPKTAAEQAAVLREADFAFKQAFIYCPYSPETLSRYASLLAQAGRFEDAILLAKTSQGFDEEGSFAQTLVDQLERYRQGASTLNQMQTQIAKYEETFRTNTTNLSAAFALVSGYLSLQNTNEAYHVLDTLVANPHADAAVLLSVARAYVDLNLYGRSEPALRRLVAMIPDNPEVWYDLAGAQANLGKAVEAVQSLRMAIQFSDRRLTTNPGATNLHILAANDTRFLSLHGRPDFQSLLAPK